MRLKLPDLGYSYDALEPFIDSRTMEIHYLGHHAHYLKNFRKIIEGKSLEKMEPEAIFANVSNLPLEIRNFGGGFFNHSFYWKILSPSGGGKPENNLMDSIVKYFGTFDNFKRVFSNEANSVFGSGWTWLIKKTDGELRIISTANQDNPLMDLSKITGKPIIAIDLWEHAYHSRFYNNRQDYISTYWNFVNWKQAEWFYDINDIQISWKDLDT
jgi:superoxide dismutase, Fe-Mn family